MVHRGYNKFNVGMMFLSVALIPFAVAYCSFNLCGMILTMLVGYILKLAIGVVIIAMLMSVAYHYWIYRVKE